MEQLRKRSREGRKERSRKPSTGIRKEGTGNQAGEKEESQEGKPERHTGEAAVRQKREERNGRNREPSSRKQNRRGRKKPEGKRKRPEEKSEGKHLRNSCGSESGKGERKQTAKLSTGTGKECTGNQAGKNGENRESESGIGALRKPL